MLSKSLTPFKTNIKYVGFASVKRIFYTSKLRCGNPIYPSVILLGLT